MNKFISLVCFAYVMSISSLSFAEAGGIEVDVRYTQYSDMPEIKILEESEDDLYSGADVTEVVAVLSEEERQQELSTDFDYIAKEYEMPELSCENPNLTKQVAQFIENHFDNDESSVPGKRNRILLIKNLHNFSQISQENLNKTDNFKAKAALMNLHINENREISKICVSKDNNFDRYDNIYLIIYPYLRYYKVVVTNLITVPEKLDAATFIYSW